MARGDELLSLNEIGRLAGVSKQTAQRWHDRPAPDFKSRSSGLKKVAGDLGVEVPEAYELHPRYPRRVVEAYLKAIGYMNADGSLVEEIQQKGGGRWTPVRPTIDPTSRGGNPKLRYYTAHVAEELDYASIGSFEAQRSRDFVPEPDGRDELFRPFWYAETLQAHKKKRGQRRRKAPEPDGFDSEGRPYKLL